jgi:hypothetical protein
MVTVTVSIAACIAACGATLFAQTPYGAPYYQPGEPNQPGYGSGSPYTGSNQPARTNQPPRTNDLPPEWRGRRGRRGPPFLEVFVPAARPDPLWTDRPLAPGVEYFIEVSGSFSVWGDRRSGVDAYYGYDSDRVGGGPQVWAQLLVDDRPMIEIARANGDDVSFHTYHSYVTRIRGTGRPLKLQIADARSGSWQDNHGGLTVRLSARGGGPPVSAWQDRGGPGGAPPPPPPQPLPVPQAIDVVGVSASEPNAMSSRPLAPGVAYAIEVSGVFSVWGDRAEGVDAYYVYDRERSGGQPRVAAQLLVDDRPMIEVARENGDATEFNPGHVYVTTVRGQGRPVRLQIADARNGSWRDNRGRLTVRIYPR